MIDYESMTNNELNKLVYESFYPEGRYVNRASDDKIKKGYMDYCTAVIEGGFIKWDPTDRYSAQVENHIFHKLKEIGRAKEDCYITIHTHWTGCFKILINYQTPVTNLVPPKTNWQISAICHEVTEKEKINRTKVIGCLMALDRLRECHD